MKPVKLILVIILALLTVAALNAQKSVYVPNILTNNTPLTFQQAESDNFVIFYGDLVPANYNPQTTLDILEYSYSNYADTMNYNTSAANNLQYKFIVMIDESWSFTPSPNTATPNSVKNFDNVVDGIWLDFSFSNSVSESLFSHETGHLFQRVVNTLNAPAGEPLTYQDINETHAQYLSYNVYKTLAPDYLGNQNKSRESWLRQNVYSKFHLMFYLQDKLGSIGMNGFYGNLYFREHPFKGYGRIFNKTISSVNDVFAEYAMRTVNFDFTTSPYWETPLNLFERNGILEANFDLATGWYDVPAISSANSVAPEAYGFNVHEIETYNASNIEIEFESTKLNDLNAGNRYGFVAIENGVARYSPIYSDLDAIATFTCSSAERVFLVVTGAPTQYEYINTNDIYNAQYDYPYRYKINHETTCAIFLQACNDNDDCTISDVYDANCECNGVIDYGATFNIPFVSVNPDFVGWNLFNNQTFTLSEGDNLGLSWAGTTINTYWYKPDGTLIVKLQK